MTEVREIPVVIVGAGPTGMVLALHLALRGVAFEIIDKADGPGERSRAMVVQTRTLEFYKQLGFADEVLRQGVEVDRARVRRGGERGRGKDVLELKFKNLGHGESPFATPLAYPQDDHERLLLRHLNAVGVQVRWRTELRNLVQTSSGVELDVAHRDGTSERVRAQYVCGCDGAHSRVREALGIGFPGGTYAQLYYVADVRIDGGFVRDFVMNAGSRMFAVMLPVRSRGVQRIIGLLPEAAGEREDLTFEDIRAQVEPLIDVDVTEVNWFSTYRVHHRVASSFRIGRVFLLGDAGHVHSPVGGQGMNTGIGDAVNLGWKLSAVLQGRASTALLATYEPERIAFARRLVRTTDQAFNFLIARGWKGGLNRMWLMPALFRFFTYFRRTRRLAFRTLGQLTIQYRRSALSFGRAGRVHGGDRLPWVNAEKGATDNFTALRSLEWQVHIYGDAKADVRRFCSEYCLALHEFQWTAAAGAAGFAPGCVYLVRPDGYVAVAAAANVSVQALRFLMQRFQLQFADRPAR